MTDTAERATTTTPAVEDVLARLTLAEKCAMVTGLTPWIVGGVERLGVPEWTVSDGPVGVRGRGMGPGLVVPGESALAATWDPDLVHEVGVALGEECLDKNVDMILGPTVNVHRAPRGGRHFESFSEDPHLSSRLAVGYIRGVQSTGVGACIKHFVCNDQETDRMTIDVRVDERTLRELYLPAFEAAVGDGGVRSVMAAYNYVNGEHACSQTELLGSVLKDEWGFDGFVVSDWGAMKDTVLTGRGGLDLEMGSDDQWGRGKLLAAVEAGEVPEAAVDDKVRRLLGFLEWRGRLQGATDHTESPREHPEHREVVRRAATESFVLVANRAAGGQDATRALPLARGVRVALIGPGAAETALMGGGSASLEVYRTGSVLDSLRERLGPDAVAHAPGVSLRRSAEALPAEWVTSPVTATFHRAGELDGPSVASQVVDGASMNAWHPGRWPVESPEPLCARVTFTADLPVSGTYRAMAAGFGASRLYVDGRLVADNTVDTVHISLGTGAGASEVLLEAGEHAFALELDAHPARQLLIARLGLEYLPRTDADLADEAVALARDADVAIVVAGTSGEWETEGADRASLALPKDQDGLIARVAAANQNTVVVLNCGAPVTMPWLSDAAAVLLGWYPGQEGADALVDVLVGDAEPGGRMPTTWARDEADTPAYGNFPGADGVVTYAEGLYVGYRHYDARGIEPLVPFGHGLSYTTFAWGEPVASGVGTSFVVEVPVTNTGARAGSEVVQVYVAPPAHGVVDRPVKELRGFAKLRLAPGERGVARIELGERAFCRWDTDTHAWVVDPGEYSVIVAASATDVRGRVAVFVG